MTSQRTTNSGQRPRTGWAERTGTAAFAILIAFAIGCKDKPSSKGRESPAKTKALDNKLSKELAAIVATCAEAKGKVEVRRAGKADWEEVVVGAVFRQGDRIRTGSRSYARVQFQVGGALELDEDTAITVDVAAISTTDGGPAVPSAIVAVESGSVRGVISQNPDPDAPKSTLPSGRLHVRTADGESAALVTDQDEPVEFRLTRREEKTEVAVEKGKLKLVTDEGGAAELESGQAADLAKTGLGKVASLIDFPSSGSPGIDARFHFRPGLTIKLSWSKVKGAQTYRVQIARDMGFQSIVVSEQTASLTHAFSPEEEGMYAWRVSARDRDGRSGESGFARRIYCEPEVPKDLLVAPKDGAKFAITENKKPAIVFSWQSAGETSSYRLAVWRTGTGARGLVLSKVVSSQSFTADDLGEGRYSWGVYARGELERPLFIKPRQLTVKKRKPPTADTDGLWD